ncbi:hypothetical protein [Desulfobacula phenolica]|uniref:hypothetical protein n=1 Tax=Desulfobacula phenolica TaxID=90732 RepID=UPI000B80FFB0|nr:hypothetical protein [Desulfobacula phenolica]
MNDTHNHAKTLLVRLNSSRYAGLVWLVLAGSLAGCGFNIAFGTFFLDMQGLLGGAISGVLIHAIS